MERRGRRALKRAAVALSIATAGLIQTLPPAAANHLTCAFDAYRPWAVHSKSDGDVYKVRGAGELNCADGTQGSIEVNLQRYRGWLRGWQKVDDTFKDLDENGNSGFVTASYTCDGDGTYTYRTFVETQVYHPGEGNDHPNWFYNDGLSGKNRFKC